MPRVAKALSALQVQRLTTPGLHAVGEVAGLALNVKTTGARSWVLRTTVAGRRGEFGLGGYPTVTLAQAREAARELLREFRAGRNPVAERLAHRRRSEWTFTKVAEAYIAAHRAGWKNAKHAAQWESTLKTYVYPIVGDKHVAEVSKADVLAVLEQPADAGRPDGPTLWQAKNETATRVRNRIELVLSYAVQREYRPDAPNPARWKGNLDAALPAAGKVAKVEHFAALPIDGMHGFVQRLRQVQGMGARALELAILTATRSGEVRGARWSEIDLQAGVWTLPPARTKASREHRVPLSAAALALLEALPRFEDVDLVFPGKGDKPLSDMTLTAVLRRLKVDATAHGFRSTFSDWVAERTSFPAEVREMALAHAIGDKTEEAYRRGDLFAKRRELMQAWQRFIETPPAAGNVQALRAKG
jgi:integrase